MLPKTSSNMARGRCLHRPQTTEPRHQGWDLIAHGHMDAPFKTKIHMRGSKILDTQAKRHTESFEFKLTVELCLVHPFVTENMDINELLP